MIKKSYNVLITKLKKLFKLLGVIFFRPLLILELLDQEALIDRGFNYSKDWSCDTNKLVSSSLDDGTSPSEANPLKSYFDSHKVGKGIWKWDHYFEIYHRHFNKFVGREVHVLEIGVFSGGSLEMWRDYFGPQCHIYGVDIEHACKLYENEYTTIFIGDQSDRKFWKSLKDKNLTVDILIDDGGHQARQQIATLEETISLLSPGGIYLCEDIESTQNPFTTYLYGLVKNLNERKDPPDQPFGEIFDDGATKIVKSTQWQRMIKSIHFYPYVVVIEKAGKPVEELIARKHGTSWQPFYDIKNKTDIAP